MKLRYLLPVLLLFFYAGLQAQIKIGDNPQNLDAASVLELESTSRVFVITRITMAEMNAINPLQGAMVYNTDEQCLFYFDGTEWINLCDALRLTFTADPIFNDYQTIEITTSEDNVNFEVREIRGSNIVDFSITSVDIQNNAITSAKLAPDSVGNEELQDNTVGDAELDYAQVTLSDFTNDAGFITSAAIVSADAGNAIIPGSDNGAFLDLTPVQTALNDLDVAVTTISLVDNGDGTYSFSDSQGNIQLITTNGLTVTNTVAGNLIATLTLPDGSSTNINETITSLTDAGDGFITYTKEDGTQETVAKSDLTDNGDGTYTFTNNNGTDVVLNTNGLTVTNTVPGNLIATFTLADGTSTDVNETITALTDNGDGLITFTKEDGTQETVAKADITDNLDGTYTFANNDGTDVLLSTNGLTVSNTLAGNLIATLTQADGSTTDINETITSLVDNGDGFVTYIKEDGTSVTVAKADITDNGDGTYTFTNNDGADVTVDTNGLVVNNTLAGNLIATLTQADGSSADINETITSLVDNGDGFVTFVKEDGTSDTVAKADITDNGNGTYTFTNNDGTDVTVNTSGLVVTNTVAGNLIATLTQADGSSSDINETVTSLVDNGDGFVTFVKEDGTSDTVAKADITDNLDGTFTFNNNDGVDVILDFNAAALPFDNSINGFIADNVQAAIEEVSGGSTDDQIISTDGTPGNIDLEDGGGPIVINVDDADADATNELNTGLAMVNGSLEVSDAGGTLSENLISSDVNNNLIFGTDGRLYLNVDAAASGETITSIVDNGDGTFTYTNENLVPVIISKADLTDNGDGTYTFTNNDGTDETVDTRAVSNPYDNTVTGLLTSTNVQAALDELAGGADNQDISTDNTPGNISIQNGSTLTLNVDDADADPNNEIQDLSLAANTLSLTGDATPVDLSGYLDNTDAQTVSTTGAAGNLSISGGNTITLNVDDADADPNNEIQDLSLAANTLSLSGDATPVDLSGYLDNTDAQDLSLTGNTLSLTGDASPVDLSGYLDNTDAQDLTGASLSGANILQIDIQNGASTTVDLSSLDDPGTDDQTLTLAANSLSIEDGNSVDLSGYLDNTDAQDLSLTGNSLSLTGDATPVDLSGYLDNTDSQDLTGASLSGANILQIDIQNGASTTVDLSSLDNPGTDDQTLTLAANSLSIEDGNSVDLSGYLDNTDAQDLSLTGNSLSLTGDATPVDLSGYLDNTDAQTVSTTGAAGNLSISGGNTITLNVDDADADPNNEIQDLSLAANTLSLSGDATPVDLSGYLDNTDAQDLSLTGNTLSLTGDATPVDLSGYLDNTDAQTLATTGAAGNLSISGGNTITLNVDDADADPNNEIQDLSLAA
ncbi:beta strand repeat-containing protein, partial [Muriicola marianensis]